MASKEKKIRILIVDDEKASRMALRYGLDNDRAFIIEEASDGKEALQKMEICRADIIILDVTMPVMDGFQAYRKLKENPETRGIPIIFLTAQSYKDISRQVPISPDEYIEKPYELKDLQIKIDRVIKNYCISP